ncbi:uncharacterized protein LOC143265835 isoform X2 [Megachile rotundata]|uniref:uncharacterized protein LOC143265835 isoform X2 n=1 Tax=Megachile rotundata TaxID=143995 RepID=UPI003FD40DF6
MPTPANCTCVDIVSYCTSTTQNSVILSQSAQEQWDVFRDRLPRSDLIRLPTLISPCGSRMVPTTQEDLGRRRRFAPRIAFPGETTFFEQREERLSIDENLFINSSQNEIPDIAKQFALAMQYRPDSLPIECDASTLRATKFVFPPSYLQRTSSTSLQPA